MGFPAAVAREGPALWTRSAAVRERDAAYATATIELFSRLWHELEKLNNAARATARAAPAGGDLRLLSMACDAGVHTAGRAEVGDRARPPSRGYCAPSAGGTGT